METIIPCFVSLDNKAVCFDSETKTSCIKYQFDLRFRQMTRISLTPTMSSLAWLEYDAVAHNFFDQLVGTSEKLIEFAKSGQLNEASLVTLLDSRIREIFLDVCAILEKEFSKETHSKICVDIWVSKFRYPENRIRVWRS